MISCWNCADSNSVLTSRFIGYRRGTWNRQSGFEFRTSLLLSPSHKLILENMNPSHLTITSHDLNIWVYWTFLSSLATSLGEEKNRWDGKLLHYLSNEVEAIWQIKSRKEIWRDLRLSTFWKRHNIKKIIYFLIIYKMRYKIRWEDCFGRDFAFMLIILILARFFMPPSLIH